jgi:membrane protease YdiL (CAAX protease family)
MAAAASAAKRSARKRSAGARRRPPGAREAEGRLLHDPASRRPLASLVFLSPVLAFYAVGLIWARPDLAARADLLLRQALAPLGLTGVLAPTWLVVTVLLAWHLVRRDPWRVSGRLLGRMLLETVILTVPLLVLLVVMVVAFHRETVLAMPAAGSGRVGGPDGLALAMTSIGAGIYEELLFRLLMVGGALWLARKVLRRDSPGVAVAVILIAAGIFAGAHTLDNPNRFAWDSFLFRSAAGTYLGYVFVQRGFGVAVGVHIVFDLLVKFAPALR